MKLFVLFLISASAWAQIERPRIGMMLDQSGNLRPVIGVAGSATLGDPVLSGVLSSACSARLCLAKTESAIVVLPGAFPGGSIDAPPGPAIIELDGDQAYVYFPESGWMGRWHDGILDRLDITSDFPLDFSTLRSTSGTVIFTTDDGLRIVRNDGTETDLTLSGIAKLLALGEGYVEVVTTNGIFALRVDTLAPQLFLLPGSE